MLKSLIRRDMYEYAAVELPQDGDDAQGGAQSGKREDVSNIWAAASAYVTLM